EDANLKLLRSLPSAWNNIALIMRNKSDLDTLSMDDLYNNLKVYESEIKVQSSSSSYSQNMAFVSSENTSSTNEAVNTAHEVSTASSQGQASSSTYADDVMFSFFANQSNSPQLDNEDLEHIDTNDLEEMDLKWKSMRMEQYLTHTDYALWEVIMNDDAPAIASASTEGLIPPKNAEQKLARNNELKAKGTLLLAIPDEHLF
ncbi:hypothetical protein Tco_1048030, partial [Tanacetum coccineum]